MVYPVLLCFSIILIASLHLSAQGKEVAGGGLRVGSCSKTVIVESTEVYNYLANVTFKVPSPHHGIWVLSMTTDEPFAFFGGWGIKVQVDQKTHSFVKITSLKSQNLNTGTKIGVSLLSVVYASVNVVANELTIIHDISTSGQVTKLASDSDCTGTETQQLGLK